MEIKKSESKTLKISIINCLNEAFISNLFKSDITVIENNINRRPDIVLFVNGLPLVVIELKNPADEKADKHNIVEFFKQFKGYIPENGITQDLEN